MKLKAMILTMVALLLTVTVTAAEPEQVTDEAMCTTTYASIGDMSVLIDHLTISHSPVWAWEAYRLDYNTDGIIDFRDVIFGMDCRAIPECELTPFTSVCDPAVIWSSAAARARGSASVALVGTTATVTGVGSTGDDGVRIWPSMEDNWKSGVRAELENVELGGSSSEGARFAFTAVSGIRMDWQVWAEASHDGGVIGLTIGFEHITAPTLSLRAFDGGDETGSGTLASPEMILSGDPVYGTPTITAVSLVNGSSTILAIEFDRAIEFTIAGLASPAFLADRLVFSSTSAIQPSTGLGPFDVTGTDLGSFTVSYEELGIIHLPCVGRVGDANGVGGDEPTIGDISTMIYGVFIANDCEPVITSLDEADVNQSGTPNAATCYNITIGDISILIDYLFIDGPSVVTLNNCF